MLSEKEFVEKDTDKRERIGLTGVLTIGRSPSNVLVLSESRVSQQHALIKPQGDGFVLIDQGSTNGTLLNSVRIPQFYPQPLSHGDDIYICSTKIVFYAQEDNHLSKKSGRAKEQRITSVIITDEGHDISNIYATLDAKKTFILPPDKEKESEKGDWLSQDKSRSTKTGKPFHGSRLR